MRIGLVGTALVLLGVLGCAKSPYQFAPVSGRVMLNGKPLANATVTFQPQGSADGKTRPSDSFGKTDAEGRFSLVAVMPPNQRGAAVGKHRVWVRTTQQTDLSDDLKKDVEKVVPQRYFNGQVNLTFEVPPGGSDAANFDLTSP